jgi:MoxR-like ATPase
MILLQSYIDGTSYQIKPIANQPAIKGMKGKLDDLRITGPVAQFAKSPVGTLFVSKSYDFPEEGHLHVLPEKLYSVWYDNFVFPINTMTTPEIQEIATFVAETMIDNPEFGSDVARKYAEAMKPYGAEIDIEAMINPPMPEPTPGMSLPVMGNLKRTIADSYPVPNYDETGFYINPDVWFLLVRNVLRKENTLLVGPTGSGKTEILSYLSKAVNKDLHIQDMGTVQDAQSALLGVHRINNEGHSAFDYAPFVSHIKSGGIVLLDELNRAPLAANNVLFPCLDKRRYLPVDIACDDCDRKIAVNDDTVFFATANLGAEYSGTHSIDRALLDRFFPIELGYPEEKHEISVLMKRAGVHEKAATAIVRVSNEIRKQFKLNELSNTVSVRHTLQAAGLIADGFETDKALLSTVLPLFEDGIGVSERSKILSIVSAF